MTHGGGQQALLDALSPERWQRVNRELVAKLLTELEYEGVIVPQHEATAGDVRRSRLRLGPGLTLTYGAHRRAMGWWRVDPSSLQAEDDAGPVALPDAAAVAGIGATALGADASTTAGLVGEVAMTALSDAYQLAHGRPADELLDLDPLLLEGEMRGHPWIVAGKGRMGFDADDLLAYAPEAGAPVALRWLAAAPGVADAQAVSGLDNARATREQVGEHWWAELRRRAAGAGLDPDQAVYLPVHPWQWTHRILTLHAGDLAARRLMSLGETDLAYAPQQSIRTLADLAHPERRYLKLAVSILNTSVYRGLPRARTIAAPALTRWLTEAVAADPFLRETGMVLLGEVASVSVPHAAFAAIPGVPYQHTEMLGAIWRESVAGRLSAGERAITLAALIHRDPAGTSFAELLIRRSGLEVDAWVETMHRVTLPPLLHTLYRLGASYSPHAQNCMLVLRDDVPTRLVVKDFVDDAMICADPIPELAGLPPDVRAALGEGVPAMVLAQWIQSGLLVCVHRYLSEILVERLGYPEQAFWAAARRVVDAYHERMAPELGDRFALFDVEAPAFVKLCLNRVRILGRGYDDGADRPVAAAEGVVPNPLAPDAQPV